MALPSEEEIIEAGKNAIKEALKRLHPRLDAGDRNRTQYDDAGKLPTGMYVGVIERCRLYQNNRGETGTAIVFSLRGDFDLSRRFQPKYFGSYEVYFPHANDYWWDKLVYMYQSLRLTVTGPNGEQLPLETADQIVDVDPVGCVVEVFCKENKAKTRNYLGYFRAAKKDYPLDSVTDEIMEEDVAQEDGSAQAPQPTETATPPDGEFASPEEYDPANPNQDAPF
jgi:hypothetical protein